MNTYSFSSLSTDERRALLRRPSRIDPNVAVAAAKMCREVKANGDEAVTRFTSEFDGVERRTFRVSEDEIRSAAAACAPSLLNAIRTSIRNVRSYHAPQGLFARSVEVVPGVRCWREIRPIDAVGLYVPAGSAPLPSTLIMLAVPALLSGCPRIVVCSPPRRGGSVDPTVLTVASELGITNVFAVGGVQAIAALAYGTEQIPRVDKVFGPGNAYVTAAKHFISSDADGTAIDLPAGPSELLIIADATANADLIAADLLSQAEHDPSSQVVLVTTDAALGESARQRLLIMARTLPRADIAARSLSGSFVLTVASLQDAVRFANAYAPEHLSIQTAEPESVATLIRNAGSVFLGPWSPVAAGDYASGTNHTLPTGGYARSTSGITVESFSKTISFQKLTRDGLATLRPTLVSLSTAEGLSAHTEAVEARFR